MTNVGLTAASEKTRLAAQTEDPRMAAFDYGTQAELFPTRSRKTRRQPVMWPNGRRSSRSPASSRPAGWNGVRTIGATLVYFQSSCLVVGKPNPAKHAIAFRAAGSPDMRYNAGLL